MKFISLGLILFALTLCGLTEKLKQMGSDTSSNTATNTSNSSSTSSNAEKAKLTAAQQVIVCLVLK